LSRESLNCLNTALELNPSCEFAISQRSKLLLEFPISQEISPKSLPIAVQKSADAFAHMLGRIKEGDFELAEYYQKHLNEWSKEVVRVAKNSLITATDLEFEWFIDLTIVQ